MWIPGKKVTQGQGVQKDQETDPPKPAYSHLVALGINHQGLFASWVEQKVHRVGLEKELPPGC